VADGWAARNFDQLKLAESEEMKADLDYLETAAAKFRAAGLTARTHLALGDPPKEILKTAIAENCDLIAMASHGHKFVGDMIYGSTIHKVRHEARMPVLLVRAVKKG
jgi:manganese transport protein